MIRLLKPAPGNLGESFSDHAARRPNYGFCGQDIGWRTSADWTIIAAQSGTVTFAGWSGRDYGYLVVIDHGGGITTWYAHFESIAVNVGQSVRAGDRLGVMGASGNAAGRHLHFELRINGVQVDPVPYFSSQWAGDATDLIEELEDDMIVKRIRRDGVGEFYLFVSPTIVSLSRELSGLKPDDRAFEDRVAAAMNDGRTPDYWDETPNGSWYLRNQLAGKVAGMPTDYPLAPSNPYRAGTVGVIKVEPPAQVNVESIGEALAADLAARLAN